MNVVIGIVSPAEAWVLPRRFVEELRQAFPAHTFIDAWDREELRRVLPDADVAFAAFVDRDLVPSLGKLRWVQAPAAGVGHLLSEELVASQIVLTSARGVRARPIAEHVMGMVIALSRQLPLVLRRQAEHRWALDEIESARTVRTLQGRRLTIVGLGSIGVEIARLAAPFGLRVSAVRKHTAAPVPDDVRVDEVVAADGLLELLSRTDVLVLSTALTPETRSLIGRQALDAIKRGALLINIGRGKLLDDAAVVDALKDGRLGGAALDVFTREPLDADSPYWDLPNVIVTPHMSGAMEDYWTPLVALFAENLRRFEAGQPLLNVVDKRAGY